MGTRISARKVKITIRHQDWDLWENGIGMGVNFGFLNVEDWCTALPDQSQPDSYTEWKRQFIDVHGLEEIEMEMEAATATPSKAEMNALLEDAKRYKFPLRDGRVAVWDEPSGLRESCWTGKNQLKDVDPESIDGVVDDDGTEPNDDGGGRLGVARPWQVGDEATEGDAVDVVEEGPPRSEPLPAGRVISPGPSLSALESNGAGLLCSVDDLEGCRTWQRRRSGCFPAIQKS